MKRESTQRVFIEGPLPGLNKFIASAKENGSRRGRKGRRFNKYAAIKKHWMEMIDLVCKAQGIRPVTGPASFRFTWFEKDRRRDPDNLAAGGRKLILDGFVKAGVLQGDGWRHVREWTDDFQIARDARRPGVLVEIKGRTRGGSK